MEERTDLGLGPHPPVSLAQARQNARENRSLVKSGGKPSGGEAGRGEACGRHPPSSSWPGST